MQKRSPASVFFLSLITFGIYALVWHVKTKNELNRLGANIPTAWLLIVPLANLYWVWKYCEGVEQVSHGQISAVLALILLLLLSIVGLAIMQSEYNKLDLQPASPSPVPGGPGVAAQPDPLASVAAAPQAPTPPPVGTPVFPTPPAVEPTVSEPADPVEPPAPPNLPPSPIQ